MRSIDLNCDMGEGCGADRELMPHISSANIACGFHAGDERTMIETARLALEHGVAIGAHPGYPDRKNFGRTNMDLPPKEVEHLVAEQVTAMRSVCNLIGARLHHVKPHGALYNQAAKDPELAAAIAKAVLEIDRELVLYGLAGSHSINEAKRIGLRTASEVFADRTYAADGALTPRSEPDALITNDSRAVGQVWQIVSQGTVTTTDGRTIAIAADTVCIHGDGERAAEFATKIRQHLISKGIKIRPPL